MATNNVNNKVTFWNNVSFTPEDVKNNFILNDKPGLDNKGIYFNLNNNYPHIIYNGYIYTTGSYVSTYTMAESTEIINAITSITADPFTKSISYQYTQINIGNIISRIEYLEKQASIIDTTDTITLLNNNGSPFTGDKIALLVGESKTIKYSTKSEESLSNAISYSPNIASVIREDDKKTITITAADKLTAGDDNTQKAQIELTSYDGLIGDIRYKSTISTIYAYVDKKTQTISYGTSFTGKLTVDSTAELIIHGAHTEITYTTAAGNINLSKSEDTIYITPTSVGTGSAIITVYATSNEEYKKSIPLEIQVTISAKKIQPTGIKLIPSTYTFYGSGGTYTLTYELIPNDANTDTRVTFARTDGSSVSVNETSGEVTPIGRGTTIITATTANNISASCEIIVEEGSVQSLAVTPTNKEISSDGGNVDFTANVTHNLFNPVFEWTIPVLNYTTTTTTNTFSYTFPANTTTTSKNYTVNVSISGQSKSANVTVKGQSVKYYWYVGSMSEADALNPETLGNIVNGKNATSSTTGISTLDIPNDAANEVIVFVYPEIWGRPTIKSENGFGTGDSYYKDEGFELPAGYNASFWPGDQAIKGKTLKITWSK